MIRKKAFLAVNKETLADFPRFIKYDNFQGTVYKGSQICLKVIVKNKGSFFKQLVVPKAIFQRKAVFPMRKKFAHFFSFYRAWRTSKNNFVGCTKTSGNHFASCNTICVTPMRLLKKQKNRKRLHFEEKSLSIFFVLSNMKENRENFINVQWVLRQIICKLEARFLRAQGIDRKIVQKNGLFPCEKNDFAFFFATELSRP